jgi:Recombinase
MGSPKGTKVPRADVGSARGAQANAANADTFAELLRSVFNELKDLSARAAARELTRRGIATARDGTWSASSVINVRERLKYQQKS